MVSVGEGSMAAASLSPSERGGGLMPVSLNDRDLASVNSSTGGVSSVPLSPSEKDVASVNFN